MAGQYKVTELTSNVPSMALKDDPALCGTSGMVMDSSHTLWLANMGNNAQIDRSVVHYDLKGNTLLSPPLPFIDYQSPEPLVPPSQQRQLISDLLWLQKNVLYSQGQIMSMPKLYPLPPILGTPSQQPSTYELSMRTFYNRPNGYLGSLVDITFLMNFCINRPTPLTTPAGKQATTLLAYAHNNIYVKLILDLTNQNLIRQYGGKLMEAQLWLTIGAQPLTDEGQEAQTQSLSPSGPLPLSLAIEPVPRVAAPTWSGQLPIALVVNKSKGFVGYPLNSHRASSNFIFAGPNGVIYDYSTLINVGDYYGTITVLDNSSSYSVYTGLATANDTLYAVDMANRRVEVYDFGWVASRDTTLFVDPNLPEDYSPFNIIILGSEVYILYAKIDLSNPLGDTPLLGVGYGLISQFTLDGAFVKRVLSNGLLNLPWGLTTVKNGFGGPSAKYVVGNRGDGRLLVYDKNWNFIQKLKYVNHVKSIDGLYGLCFYQDALYFAASPGGTNGLFGKIKLHHHHHHHPCGGSSSDSDSDSDRDHTKCPTAKPSVITGQNLESTVTSPPGPLGPLPPLPPPPVPPSRPCKPPRVAVGPPRAQYITDPTDPDQQKLVRSPWWLMRMNLV